MLQIIYLNEDLQFKRIQEQELETCTAWNK